MALCGSNRVMAWSIKGDVKKILLPRPEGGEISATSSPSQLWKALVWGSCPGIGFALFHLSGCIFTSSDDADRFVKLSKPCGCMVSTMGLSEARGPSAFSGYPRGHRGYAETGCHRHRVVYRPLSYSPSNLSISTDWPPPEKITGDGGLFTRDAQAACDFSFSASKFSPFFQRVSVIAAILRASVRRAIVGLMPLASAA